MKAQKLDALLFPGAGGAAIAAKPGYPTVIVPFGTVPNAPTPAAARRLRGAASAVRRQLHRHGLLRASADRARLCVRAGDAPPRAAAVGAVMDAAAIERLRELRPDLSWSRIRSAIERGQVTVDDIVTRDPAEEVEPSRAIVVRSGPSRAAARAPRPVAPLRGRRDSRGGQAGRAADGMQRILRPGRPKTRCCAARRTTRDTCGARAAMPACCIASTATRRARWRSRSPAMRIGRA